MCNGQTTVITVRMKSTLNQLPVQQFPINDLMVAYIFVKFINIDYSTPLLLSELDKIHLTSFLNFCKINVYTLLLYLYSNRHLQGMAKALHVFRVSSVCSTFPFHLLYLISSLIPVWVFQTSCIISSLLRPNIQNNMFSKFLSLCFYCRVGRIWIIMMCVTNLKQIKAGSM